MKPPKCRLCEKSHWGNCAIQTQVQPGSEPSPARTEVGVLEVNTDAQTLYGGAPGGGMSETPVSQQKTNSIQKDAYCDACGTNLSARIRKRKRRAKYMKQHRKDKK